MPIKDVAAQAASLANDYGATKGPNAPANFEVEIWVGDPLGDGFEMPATGGYAAVLIPNDATHFPAPDPATAELTTEPIVFATSTAAWSEVGTHWLLRDPVTGAAWDCAAFDRTDRVNVTAAGFTPRPALSIFYNNLTE